jgi:outer membrane protein assembly factor BamB
MKRLFVTLSLCLLLLSACDEDVTIYPDLAPPEAVTDLQATDSTRHTVTLSWTAPKDTDRGGIVTAAAYDIRYAATAITDTNWSSVTPCPGVPKPQSHNTPENFTVTGLSPSTTYYFALKTVDHASNWSGLSSVAACTTPEHLQWTFKTGRAIYSSPAVDGDDGTIYVGSDDQRLYALDPGGTEKWSYQTYGAVMSSPTLTSDGTIYVGSSDRRIYALDSAGHLIWLFITRNGVLSTPAIGFDGTIFVGSMNDRIYALNPEGSVKWWFESAVDAFPSPTIGFGGCCGIVYVGAEFALHALDHALGSEQWSFGADHSSVRSLALGSDQTIYVGSNDGRLYAISSDGSEAWSFDTGGQVRSSAAIASDGTIYVGSDDYKLYALDPTGSMEWSFETGGRVRSSPAIAGDGTIYVGSDDHRFYAINPDGSEKWSFETGGEVMSSPAIANDGTVYVGCSDGKLYAFYGESPLATTPWPMFRHDTNHSGRWDGP